VEMEGAEYDMSEILIQVPMSGYLHQDLHE
jgi:hypothetical protein